MTRRKYSTFIKLSSVILIIAISSITNRYASEIKSLDSKGAANHQDDDDDDMEAGGAPYLPSKNQPFSMSNIELDSQENHDRLLPDKLNVANNSQDLINTSQGSSLNDSQGRSIYTSLMKILHSMKHQMDKSSDRRPESRMDRKKEVASVASSIDDAPIVDLFRNSGIVAQSAGNLPNESSLNYNNSNAAKTPKRNARQTKKTSSGPTHLAPQQTDTSASSNQDQGQYSDIFNEPLRENFNEMGDGLASMVGGGGSEDDTKLKKSITTTPATYSSYLGTSDQVTTTAKITNSNGKPANGKQQYAVDVSTGGSVASQPTRTFSPRFEEFAPKSWGLQQSQTFFNDDPPPPRSLFAMSTLANSKNSKPSNQESFFSPTQDPSVSFNDYEQVTTNGFSAAYNEPYQSANDLEDPPMDTMPMVAVSKKTNSKANHLSRNHQNHYPGNRQRIQSPSSSSVDGGHSTKQQRPFNSHYIDNEYLNTAQLEQQEEDGSRWPKGSVPAAPEFQESLRSARPRQGGDDHYSGIHLQQIHPEPISPASFSSSSQVRPFNYQHQSPNRNKRQRIQNHQAQQQQVFYSLVSAPPQQQNFVKSLSDQVGGGGGARVATIIQQATPTRQIYQISPSVQTGNGGQPQRDLVNQPQTIQITTVPGLGFNNNPSVLRLNGGVGPTVNGIALSNLLTHNGALLDPSGRQVVMVNADRRQIDWSFLIWPLLVVIVLPLVLSALFVPIFMKSLVLFLQILQSLGLVMPISSALGLSLASGASFANITTSK